MILIRIKSLGTTFYYQKLAHSKRYAIILIIFCINYAMAQETGSDIYFNSGNEMFHIRNDTIAYRFYTHSAFVNYNFGLATYYQSGKKYILKQIDISSIFATVKYLPSLSDSLFIQIYWYNDVPMSNAVVRVDSIRSENSYPWLVKSTDSLGIIYIDQKEIPNPIESLVRLSIKTLGFTFSQIIELRKNNRIIIKEAKEIFVPFFYDYLSERKKIRLKYVDDSTLKVFDFYSKTWKIFHKSDVELSFQESLLYFIKSENND